jgi:hypothetical protein
MWALPHSYIALLPVSKDCEVLLSNTCTGHFPSSWFVLDPLDGGIVGPWTEK